jgi:endonuclease YncB( thermonuclease family)
MAAMAGPAFADAVSGHVRVIYGDTVAILESNTHVRLNGVDAPEVVHPVYALDDDFGPESRDEMRRIVGDAIIRCELNGERSN